MQTSDNMEANDEFLIEGNAEKHNGDNSVDDEIKDKKHCSRLLEQQRKPGNVVAEQAPPPVEYEEQKTGGGDRMVEGAEAVDSPENVEINP